MDFVKILSVLSAVSAALACAAGPQVQWLGTSHNFGAFHEDEGTVECEFHYVNTGDEPLSITAARTSCGCTLPHYTRLPVQPGDTAVVAVSYDPTGRPGRFSKNVYIEMNLPEPRTTLTITGVVIGAPTTLSQRYPAELAPGLRAARGAVMAGEVARGRMKSVFLEVYNATTDTVRPQIASKPAFVDATWMPEAIAPGEQSSLVCHVRTADCNHWGLVTDSLTIAGEGVASPVVLPLTVIVSEDFSRLTPEQMAKAPVADPADERLDFGELQAGATPAEMQTRIYNRGRTPLEIRRVYCDDPGVEAAIERNRIKPGKSAVLTVRVDPGHLPGRLLNSKVMLICNDPTRPNLAVRAVGTVLKK